MNHYDFSTGFRAVYERAKIRFARGDATPATLLSADDTAFLTANGINVQHLYDYVDDLAGYGEPSYDQAHAIELVRRDYFHNTQNSLPSNTTLDPATLPAKSDAVRGISWLPRLLPKARAKLRGELPSALMYGCGGDRAFFKQHQILPHEFLNLIWRFETDDNAVIDWVARRIARPSN
jgi:hypothetical protein